MESDGAPHIIRELPSLKSQIKLGYTIKGSEAHPFNLMLKDFRNLVILGEHAKDIYYLFLSQLCDQLQLPIVVLKEKNEDDLESLICEIPIWHLDTEVSQLILNPLDLGDKATPIHAHILASILSHTYKLSLKAQKLLQVAIWSTIKTSPKPSLQELRQSLQYFEEHEATHNELHYLLEALDKANIFGSFDNVSLGRFHSVPTILSVPRNSRGRLVANLLLLKLLAGQVLALPPLVIFDLPLDTLLIELLFRSYATSGDFLLFLDSKGRFPQLESQIPYNLIFSALSESSTFCRQLSTKERDILQSHHDLVAVKLFNKPLQLVNVF